MELLKRVSFEITTADYLIPSAYNLKLIRVTTKEADECRIVLDHPHYKVGVLPLGSISLDKLRPFRTTPDSPIDFNTLKVSFAQTQAYLASNYLVVYHEHEELMFQLDGTPISYVHQFDYSGGLKSLSYYLKSALPRLEASPYVLNRSSLVIKASPTWKARYFYIPLTVQISPALYKQVYDFAVSKGIPGAGYIVKSILSGSPQYLPQFDLYNLKSTLIKRFN